MESSDNRLFLQLFTFNNSLNSNGVYGTQHKYDKTLAQKMMQVMEK
jgi:hypothetical protein